MIYVDPLRKKKEGVGLEVSEVLSKALRLMELDGWNQGSFQNGMGHDPTGAIWSVLEGHGHEWTGDGRMILMGSLRALRSGAGMANIGLWNDQPERTFDQVRETFMRGICESELRERRLAA